MTLEAARTWAEYHRRGRRSLSEFQRAALELVMQHRIMTRPQIRALLAPDRSEQTVRNELAQLEAAGYLGRAGLLNGRVTVVHITAAGAEIAAAVRPWAVEMTDAGAARAGLDHTLAVNDVGIAFVRHARARGHECGPWDWEHEITHRTTDSTVVRSGNLVTSDARLRCMLRLDDDDDVAMTCLLELDRATTSPIEVYERLRRYVHVLTYVAAEERGKPHPRPFWRLRYARFPTVLVVFTGVAESLSERRMTAVLDLCRDDDGTIEHVDELGLRCTTMRQLDRRGPFEPIWRTPGTTRPVDLLTKAAPVRTAGDLR